MSTRIVERRRNPGPCAAPFADLSPDVATAMLILPVTVLGLFIVWGVLRWLGVVHS
jgi:hypothetical protein